MQKQRNYSMDIFRFVAALFVVVCHVDFLKEAADGIYQFVARFSPRVSVSFFFAISGYYYINALLEDKKIFKKQFFSLVKVYACWSVIYYAASFVVNIVLDHGDIKTFLIERVVFFLTKGSYSHFWYFPALIYSVVLATCFHKFFGKKGIHILTILSLFLFVLANLGSSYFPIGMKIPGLNQFITNREVYEVLRGILGMGLPYFMIGYVLYCMKNIIENVSSKTLWILLGVGVALYFGEIFLLSNVLKWYEYPEVFLMLYPLTVVIMILLIRNPKPEWQPHAATMKRLSGYIYYVHPLCILVLEVLAGMLSIYIPSVVMYVLVVGFAILSGLLLLNMSRKLKWISNFI